MSDNDTVKFRCVCERIITVGYSVAEPLNYTCPCGKKYEAPAVLFEAAEVLNVTTREKGEL